MIKLTFLGTRGEIEPRTRRHRMHASLLISYQGKKIMLDCGQSWISKLKKIKPDHIVLTHAHPDHAWGLKKGAPCPVWATKETWKILQDYPLSERGLIKPRSRQKIAGLTFEAFPVWHSVRCPAVGYRITCKSLNFFYISDVAYIPELEEAFHQIQFYIGDGATLFRPMIRKNKKTGEIFGHATIRQQLTWCHKQKVPQMIITHCGADIVTHEKQRLQQIEKLAREREVEALIAYDGMEIVI